MGPVTAARRIIEGRIRHARDGIRTPISDADLAVREAGDDHFYGPWKGGSKAAGGRPGGAESAEVGGFPVDGDARMETYSKFSSNSTENFEYDWAQGSDPLWTGESAQDVALHHIGQRWESGTSDPLNGLVQSSVSEAGLSSGMVWGGASDQTLRPSPASVAAVNARYAKTQADLKSGPAEIKVYRGIGESKRASGNALESWTTDPAVAAAYGTGGVLEMTVPRSAVFLDLREPVSFKDPWRESRTSYGGPRTPTIHMQEVVLLGGAIDRGTATLHTGAWVDAIKPTGWRGRKPGESHYR